MRFRFVMATFCEPLEQQLVIKMFLFSAISLQVVFRHKILYNSVDFVLNSLYSDSTLREVMTTRTVKSEYCESICLQSEQKFMPASDVGG